MSDLPAGQSDTGDGRNMTLAEVVDAFLDLAMVPPEKPPKTQRDQRENRLMIQSFNHAQETLRTILEHHGIDEATRALAEVRNDKQQRPIDVGGTKVWLA